MKNLFFFIGLLLVFNLNIIAQSRTEDEALKIAESFLKNDDVVKLKSGNHDISLTLVYAPNIEKEMKSATNEVYYYVYNLADDNGFVIVSGDERAKQILGYSDSGSFDIDNISDNMKYWLSFYEEELSYLAKQPVEDIVLPLQEDVTPEIRTQALAPYVLPLVQAKWNQTTPYNNDCPLVPGTKQRSAVGCSAIAAAQIMHYYKWPKRGKGSLTYEVFGYNTTVNFSEASYDWENMLNVYSYSDIQSSLTVKAVSEFLYHVSFGAKTRYGRESESTIVDIGQALINYFDYNKNLQIYKREYYTGQEWKNLLKTELNAKRPVYYTGHANDFSSGHAFVCDGYDENGLFHFNWGWGGLSDGYFELSALNPGSLGVGSGSGYYNRSQDIIAGIKPTTDSSYNYQLCIVGGMTLLSSEKMTGRGTVKIKINDLYNLGLNDFTGQFSLAFISEDGRMNLFPSSSSVAVDSYRGWEEAEMSDISPLSLQDGKYKLYLVYKDNQQKNWSIIRGKAGAIGCLNAEVVSNTITFSLPVDKMPVLELAMNGVEKQKVYKNKQGQIKVGLKNNGGGEYNSLITIAFDKEGKDIIAEKIPIVLEGGETKEFLISCEVQKEDGDYNLYVLYDESNHFSEELTGIVNDKDPIKIEVKTIQVNKVSLKLSSAISFSNNENYTTPSNFDLEVKLVNEGDYFNERIYVSARNGNDSYQIFDSQYVFLEKGEETTLHFKNSPPIDYGACSVRINYIHPVTGEYLHFLSVPASALAFTYIKDTYVDINIPEKDISTNLNIYPNPVAETLFISSEEIIESVQIYCISGSLVVQGDFNLSEEVSVPVSHLSKGLYVVQIKTEKGLKTLKFQKE